MYKYDESVLTMEKLPTTLMLLLQWLLLMDVDPDGDERMRGLLCRHYRSSVAGWTPKLKVHSIAHVARLQYNFHGPRRLSLWLYSVADNIMATPHATFVTSV